MNIFSTPRELENFLNRKVKQAINKLTFNVLRTIQENIQKYTYGDIPNKWYQRTGDFEDSWYQEQATSISNEIVGGVFHDWEMMRKAKYLGFYAQETYQHGNAQLGEDRRPILASVLNVDGLNGEFDWIPKERKPFFDITIEELTNKFRQNIIDIFKNVGITLI